MSTHRHIDRVCIAAALLSLLLTILFMNGEALGIQSGDRVMGYENRLFDTSRVHSIDIVMNDWDSFIETCENEEYAGCAVIVDGESYKNVGLRAKGNTSLNSVSAMGSQRYSFKIEFDHYDDAISYHGLDKLSLNNLIQDNTCMKDYLTYRLMGTFGVAAPLCSYVWVTVNGEDWGLYLAVEAVEEAFLQRNYGSDYGELYKPDSMSFGGGRGNGRDFDFEGFMGQDGGFDPPEGFENEAPQPPDGENFPQTPESGNAPGLNGDEAQPPQPGAMPNSGPPDGWSFTGGDESPDGTLRQNGGWPPEGQEGQAGSTPPTGDMSQEGETPMKAPSFGGGPGGMGADDVRLQYIDDDPESYPNIFDNAKTDISDKDSKRLISALKRLSEGDAEASVDMEAVLRYFVVHNFVVNDDSYTGAMVHNYYLYEKDGLMSMIPWDYNLAFGAFQGSDVSAAVNDPIDDALDDRPMQSWIFSDESYTKRYHELYAEFLDSAGIDSLIDETASLISPYVERDPTGFCTLEEFEAGVQALKEFCRLRTQSVRGQLDGTIPSTTDTQNTGAADLTDAGSLNLSDMGGMNTGGEKGAFAPQAGQRPPENRNGRMQ